jgi:hypothetical protein
MRLCCLYWYNFLLRHDLKIEEGMFSSLFEPLPQRRMTFVFQKKASEGEGIQAEKKIFVQK